MKGFIKQLERKIEGCDTLGGMEREKAVYQSVLKDYRKAITVTRCCYKLKDLDNDNFEDWLIVNGYTVYKDHYMKGDQVFFESELMKKYNDNN